jgi:hypothetical protein
MIRFRTHPVVDGKGCDLQRHGDHVDSAVQQVGLKFLLQVDLLRPRKISQEVKTRSLDKKYSLSTEKNILVFSRNAGIHHNAYIEFFATTSIGQKVSWSNILTESHLLTSLHLT